MTGEALYQVCSDGLPLAASLSYARSHGGPALAHMTFQQRAQMLKAVAKHLLAHKEALYQISYQTGATRSDGWVDIEVASPRCSPMPAWPVAICRTIPCGRKTS